jgi:hypothetical protein
MTGDTTTGSSFVTGLPSTVGPAFGMAVGGEGIPVVIKKDFLLFPSLWFGLKMNKSRRLGKSGVPWDALIVVTKFYKIQTTSRHWLKAPSGQRESFLTNMKLANSQETEWSSGVIEYLSSHFSKCQLRYE